MAKKWDRLQAQIDGFHRQAMECRGLPNGDGLFTNPEAAGDRDVVEWDTDEEEEEENFFEISLLEDDSSRSVRIMVT